MGVMPRLKGRFGPIVGQNALFFKNSNSLIMLKSYLISRFKCYKCRQLFSFNNKSVFETVPHFIDTQSLARDTP